MCIDIVRISSMSSITSVYVLCMSILAYMCVMYVTTLTRVGIEYSNNLFSTIHAYCTLHSDVHVVYTQHV